MYILFCRTSQVQSTYATGVLGKGEIFPISENSELSLLTILPSHVWAQNALEILNAQLDAIDERGEQGEVEIDSFPDVHLVIAIGRLFHEFGKVYTPFVVSGRTTLVLQPEDELMLLEVLGTRAEAMELSQDEDRLNDLINVTKLQAATRVSHSEHRQAVGEA